jgi:hypothetical protein
MAKGASDPISAEERMQRTKPFAGTGCQKLFPSSGCTTTRGAFGVGMAVSGIG